MSIKTKKTFAIVTVLISFLAITFIALPWFLLGTAILFSPNPSMPKIVYSEFPFEIVYEINGEQITVQDTYVCEFDGFSANEGVGKHRTWKGYVKSTGEDHLLIMEDENTAIYCDVGEPEYYMNDDLYSGAHPVTPRLYCVSKTDSQYYNAMYPDEILEHYDIEIISWELAEPITNTFE